MLNIYANLYKITRKISTNLVTSEYLHVLLIILCAGFIAMTKLADIHYFIYFNGIGWDNERRLLSLFYICYCIVRMSFHLVCIHILLQ